MQERYGIPQGGKCRRGIDLRLTGKSQDLEKNKLRTKGLSRGSGKECQAESIVCANTLWFGGTRGWEKARGAEILKAQEI